MKGPIFVVGGLDRFRSVSSDGLNWQATEFSDKGGPTCAGAAFGNGRCALLFKKGYYGKTEIEFSEDAENWDRSEIDAKQVGHSLIFYNGQFIVCTGKTINAGHKPKVLATEDGESWTKEFSIPGRSIMTHYAEGNGRLVGIGPSGMAASTKNGTDWKGADLSTAESMISLAFGNGFFVGGGLHGQVWRSPDGLKWEKTNSGKEGEHLNATIWDGKRFLGIGLGATYLSPDGRSWDRVENDLAPLSAVRGPGGVLAGNQWKGRLLTSSDGIDWTDQKTFQRHIEVVAAGTL